MTNQFDDENNEEKEQSFAALLEAYSPGEDADLGVGDKISGKIVSIGRDSVFVDTGTKIDGVVDKAELLDENGEITLTEGDLLELYVVALSDEEIKLSRALSGIGGLNMLKEAYEKGAPVEGKISETCKGGVRVDILQRKAFCPVSQLDINFVENPSDYVGQSFNFLITTFEENGRNIVLSRRTLLAREQEAARKEFYQTLSVDTTMDGTVTRIMPYGAFVQLSPGVEGMVHISEMNWSKAAKPESLVNVADTVRVKVVGIEPDKKPGLLKISLSMKQLTEDPWDSAGELFHEGDKIQGTVTRCANFGAFVEIAPGIEGLVHISEMSYEKRVLKPEDVVTPGETVSVMIKEVDLEKRRLSLSIRDAEGDPWVDVAGKYSIGQAVKGILEKKEKFGFFINLEPGITGLLPKSFLNKADKPAELEKLKEGDSIAVTIESIKQAERKITLTPADMATEQNWQSFSDTSDTSLGALGDKLQSALDKKKSDE
ncbi:MAG: 30S ribosomal protein S1 [Desulfobacteraceae bacterium]|jgi:small subunit ribosomal protein S1|nr:30S ribosomal protein S1 [Desulfobacteraceae bacterium]